MQNVQKQLQRHSIARFLMPKKLAGKIMSAMGSLIFFVMTSSFGNVRAILGQEIRQNMREIVPGKKALVNNYVGYQFFTAFYSYTNNDDKWHQVIHIF